VCPHEFLCDCRDSLENAWACKHVHLIGMLFGSRAEARNTEKGATQTVDHKEKERDFD
jgi:hypothetical protein